MEGDNGRQYVRKELLEENKQTISPVSLKVLYLDGADQNGLQHFWLRHSKQNGKEETMKALLPKQ